MQTLKSRVGKVGAMGRGTCLQMRGTQERLWRVGEDGSQMEAGAGCFHTEPALLLPQAPTSPRVIDISTPAAEVTLPSVETITLTFP